MSTAPKLWPSDRILVMGIDPGLSGGIGLLDASNRFVEAHKMPETEGDVADLLHEWRDQVAKAWIERVHSMPRQGVSSSFKFGRSYGFLRGLLIGLRIPFDDVTPQAWQKELRCLTHGDKNVSKSKAQMLFPGLKITHSTADALLIAEYGRRRAIIP